MSTNIFYLYSRLAKEASSLLAYMPCLENRFCEKNIYKLYRLFCSQSSERGKRVGRFSCHFNELMFYHALNNKYLLGIVVSFKSSK